MKKVLCSALVAIMLLCMTACGGSSIAGRYDFEYMEMGGTKVTAQAMKDLGADMEMYIELKDDGTAIMYTEGETAELGWKDGEMWPVDDPSDKQPFEVKDGVLTMEQDGTKLAFKK